MVSRAYISALIAEYFLIVSICSVGCDKILKVYQFFLPSALPAKQPMSSLTKISPAQRTVHAILAPSYNAGNMVIVITAQFEKSKLICTYAALFPFCCLCCFWDPKTYFFRNYRLNLGCYQLGGYRLGCYRLGCYRLGCHW